MSVSFVAPSARAAASDLTISISPLGLVELSDEEFEVHGPRLNRYATNFAWYLGHHYAYKREAGEPQVTMNYVGAFARYINQFTFGRGIEWAVKKKFEHITPALLKRVWEQDNDKGSLLYLIGEQGGVTGDSFVKVAYQPPWLDSAGGRHPGQVRVLPLNSAHCFPEYAPHDRDRLIRFKLKYKFWATSLEGTRQVYTYTEILTEEIIEEYVNDELIDQRPNPLGVIPVAHTRNIEVGGSPWGMSDVSDIISLNREYNEKCTDISDIINYHAAPVTIVSGAKASNLEKGPKKVWGGIPKDAKVYNLENAVRLEGPLEYLALVKRAMHEITGVPESALGQMQPISNTSGVALAIMYLPLVQRASLKQTQYGMGFKRINELILRTLFCFEPETLRYRPETEGIQLDESQVSVIDPADIEVYQVDNVWPLPLPVDNLVKLNEIQARMALGLESKRSALQQLGEEFPDELIAEMFEEQKQDALESGALALINALISAAILQITGVPTDQDGNPAPVQGQDASAPGAGGSDAGVLPKFSASDFGVDTQSVFNELVTRAYGTRLPQRRNSEDTRTEETST